METARSRFLRYVTYYTTSDEHTGASPSTERQKDLGRVLLAELESLGLAGAHMDGAGNVIATLPAAAGVTAPVLALIAHMDTSPDASGENVKPRIVRYEGGDLPLSDAVSLTESLCPGLSAHVGEELIVTDGTTLLGADDKAGIAEIMAAVELLEGRPHGEVRVVFTTDEEIGCGVDGLDVAELACDYGYTVDGGPLGEIEYENFNAASGDVTFRGVGVHPGSAKDVMVNAATVAMAFHAMLPTDEVPEKTDGYQGFFHLHAMSGDVTEAQLHYIIRDHDRDRFEDRKDFIEECVRKMNEKWGEGTVTVELKDQYYNMKEKIDPNMHVIDIVLKAMQESGVAPKVQPIRGGTDGAQLSFKGLPCPNIFAGGCNFHGPHEFVSIQVMEKAMQVIIKICEITAHFND